MSVRKSEYAKNQKKRVGFEPELEDWRDACINFPYVYQIAKYFSVAQETMYAFIDKERCKVEAGGKSAYLEAYVDLRKQTKKKIALSLMKKIESGDTASILFANRAYNGLIEQKDIEHIELKKKQLALRSNEFLTDLAAKYKLDEKELKMYVKNFFSDTLERLLK